METTNQYILSINGGSSSIKFAIFIVGTPLIKVIEGQIARIGQPDATLHLKDFISADNISQIVTAPNHRAAVDILRKWTKAYNECHPITAIGHRVVHGGPKYWKPERITKEMIEDLYDFTPFDPEHMQQELMLIESLVQQFPSIPQIAFFDTAFHHNIPQVARMLPIPRRYESKGVRRYGFHGLSYEYLIEELGRRAGPTRALGKVILVHLGSGASLAAVFNGKSVDTSMSFTPTAGIPMSTRSGDLDPGLAWYLARTEGMDPEHFYEMVNTQSGLLGISETSSDMQDLIKKEVEDSRAADAINLFCYYVKKWIGAFTAVLGGVDTIVFSGGIGENIPSIRSRICNGLEFLGIEIDEQSNELNKPQISKIGNKVEVLIIPTDEQSMIAKNLCLLLELNKVGKI